MSNYGSCCAILALAVALASAAVPEQIHLALTGTPTEMMVDFVGDKSTCSVEYALANGGHWSALQTTASWHLPEIGYTHQGLMRGLAPNTTYTYRVGCGGMWTHNITFTAQPQRAAGLTAAFLADFGLENDVSMEHLVASGRRGDFDLMILGGDFAYDLDSNSSTIGNAFMNALQPLTSGMPWMTAAGNHEAKGNFTQYCHRFEGVAQAGNRSGSQSNFFYSWDQELVHFVAVSTEVFAFGNETLSSPYPFTAEEQFAWLEQDLAKANANRAEVPWIVMFGHKAWYMDFEPSRKHPLEPKLVTNFTGFTILAERYGVDLYLAGHVHIYQRFYSLLGPSEHTPYAKPRDVDKDCAEQDGSVYRNCKYMTTIIAGSPGDHELTLDGMCPGDEVVSPNTIGTIAMCSNNYGYGMLRVPNSTHLHWEWLETGPGNYTPSGHEKTHDALWLIQEDRAPRVVEH